VVLAVGSAGAAVYNVGPGQTFSNIGEVAWESLDPGDTVRIHYRAAPYAEKWVLCRQGNATNWIVVQGVPDAEGRLPVIEGSNATTRSQLNYWNESRGVVKIGGANTPPDTMPCYIRVENLDIKSGREPYSFTGRDGVTPYERNSAAIYVEKGDHIVIRRCVLRDCGNGFFCASGSSNVLVEFCTIYDNGAENSIYEHNNYTEARGITFQFNHFGPLRAQCLGNNLKDRSGGCVIRYNWIESGNRQLDLVDSGSSAIYDWPAYRSTFVYGNILVEPQEPGNNQICHYGGDSGTLSRYRQGILYFYNNTVVSTRDARTTLFRLSSSNEAADCRNNIVYVTASGNNLAITADSGVVNLRNNWLKAGWINSLTSGVVSNLGGNGSGSLPGFVDAGAQDYELMATSACVNMATSLPAAAWPEYAVTNEYVKHAGGRPRYSDGSLDAGAYEFNPDTDQDGMADAWELRYVASLTNLNAASDWDGDGFHDWQEYRAGTDPTDAGSRLILTGINQVPAGASDMVIEWQSASNRIYRIGVSSNIAAGFAAAVVTTISATPPSNVHTVPVVHAGADFYRVELEP
jgi:hypothetical protein